MLKTLNQTDLRTRIESLRRGEVLAITGFDREKLAALLREGRGMEKGVFFLEATVAPGSEHVLSRLLDDLSLLALEIWPNWYGVDSSETEVSKIAGRDPRVSAPWLRAAIKYASAGKPPRFRRMPLALEFQQLMRAIDPSDLILIAELDPEAARSAASVVSALEWCLEHGATAIVTFKASPAPIPPFDRILYGAIAVTEVSDKRIYVSDSVETRFIAGRGRAHPGSVIEQRLEAALRRDDQLSALFSCNEAIVIEGYGAPRVDLLWREGRVVVEIDGPEHQRDPNFTNDRHRDYELLLAGYMVLRLTNNQVATDLQRAIEKIRDVVDFRRSNRSVVQS